MGRLVRCNFCSRERELSVLANEWSVPDILEKAILSLAGDGNGDPCLCAGTSRQRGKPPCRLASLTCSLRVRR